eukprot:gnl/TRDRNA2_/TRDRNA2_126600_c0_seq1.p1 gnl/TRDRNA2_/TRDRNA2_126600_c0~~gnl/TRDRNA2_/TRDRNA2_126600_c0_seq1.p1  ORF type:complete len:338 (-),score=52.01 gnl/TRDRNA2_/TRDRNA2_126600_c0_seq1:6-1019(-)
MLELIGAGRWTLGIALSFSNAFLSSAGFTMQRKAYMLHGQQKCEEAQMVKKAVAPCTILWVAGVIVYILAALPDVFAYMLIPQVLCSCVACFRLVVVTVLAHAYLDEEIRGRELVGMVCCSVGTILCVWFGPSKDATKHVAAGEFSGPQVVIYLVCGGVVLAVLLLLVQLAIAGCCRSRGLLQFAMPFATALAYSLEKVFNTELGFIPVPESLKEDPQWLGLVAAIVLLGVLDFYLNLRGAQSMPVQVFVPVTFSLCTMLQYLQSVMIFNEFRHMSWLAIVLSLSGACLSLAGAVCINPPELNLLDKQAVQTSESDNSSRTPNESLPECAGQALIPI